MRRSRFEKEKIRGGVLGIACLIGICGYFHMAQSKAISEIPDVINSSRFNTTDHLNVVANQETVEDKNELAKQIIEMCQNNSFQSIKFSYDMVCPTELQINVYKTEKDFDDNKQFCKIAYLSEEENADYDILHDPEKFTMYVDGEIVK